MQENQQFTSVDTLSVFGLMIGVLTLVTAVVSNAMIDQKASTAKVQADRIAVQMVHGDYTTGDKGRGPASFAKNGLGTEGKISTDPWGTPYTYRIMNDVAGRYVAIVTSAGANGQHDISPDDYILDTDGRFKSLMNRGDDIVSIQRAGP